jgi:hypothetical protein
MSEWIKVSDKWPESKQHVLVILDSNNRNYSGQMFVCSFQPFEYEIGKPFAEFGMPGFGGLTASHWMPLPAPPKDCLMQDNLIKFLESWKGAYLWGAINGAALMGAVILALHLA